MISCLSPSWLRERTLSFTGGQALATHATPVRARNDRTILVVPLCIISPMVLVGLYMITSRPLSSGSCSLFSSLYFHNEMLNSSVVLLLLSASLSLLACFSFLVSYSTNLPHFGVPGPCSLKMTAVGELGLDLDLKGCFGRL